MRFKFFVSVSLFCLIGCRFSNQNKAISTSVDTQVCWEGKRPVFDSVDSLLHERHFKFIGTDTVHLTLTRYAEGYVAYSEFSKQANRSELEAGFYRVGNQVFFYHGQFLGCIQYAHSGLIPIQFLKSNLIFQNEELLLKPQEFKAFPLGGRIPNSERVHVGNFLGKNWHGPIFSVEYRCNQDTALLFRSLKEPLDSLKSWIQLWKGDVKITSGGDKICFQGRNELQDPLVIWAFPTTSLGISGCYDSALSSAYVEKLQKMTVFLPNP